VNRHLLLSLLTHTHFTGPVLLLLLLLLSLLSFYRHKLDFRPVCGHRENTQYTTEI